MLKTVHSALKEYEQKWDDFIRQAGAGDVLANLNPTSVGWKVADVAEFDRTVAALRDHCSHVLHVRLNNRWIAKMVLRDPVGWGIRIIKIMQVRPGSNDGLGLDHVDFYTPQNPAELEAALTSTNIKWTKETNHPDFSWISLWFAGTEAKLKNYTVLDIYTTELNAASATIKT